ncbi:hypothetical protein Hs30E_01150 [Lactococcus hodotermopsidis]|uniref:Lactococcin 972 family bacteriocin n=1 Tax=Pseudolactococcus hodotermopsidis TaxID=2709157 RepID=A0A6A0BB23_9LACT|nr:hypothetical protein [Lactococcus hodotermopsidis]GFH41564.1 hypothetical protein Hs30E_01150 [Lactococcus hodotermopsidis]
MKMKKKTVAVLATILLSGGGLVTASALSINVGGGTFTYGPQYNWCYTEVRQHSTYSNDSVKHATTSMINDKYTTKNWVSAKSTASATTGYYKPESVRARNSYYDHE